MSIVSPVAVTGCGVLSPAGTGLAALADHLADGRTGNSEPHTPDAQEFPPHPVRALPEVDWDAHLGRKGRRVLDRSAAIGVVAAELALAEANWPNEPTTSGVALGTAAGSLRTQIAVTQDTLRQDLPYLVNPAQIPNTVMNSTAGHIAIRHQLKGVNATLSGGAASSLLAFRYARMAIALGRAERLLAGGVEELSAPYAWGWRQAELLPATAPMGEGCALFAVADAATVEQPAAELLACEIGLAGPQQRLGDSLAVRINRALQRSGVTPEDVGAVAVTASRNSGLARAEQLALGATVGEQPRRIDTSAVVGDTYSASGALQLAALLATWKREDAAAGAIGLVTTVGPDGNVGCLVVRNR